MNRLSDHVLRVEMAVRELESKRIPDLESDLRSFKATVKTVGVVLMALVAVLGTLAAFLGLRH